jgi:WD40 repeat protein
MMLVSLGKLRTFRISDGWILKVFDTGTRGLALGPGDEVLALGNWENHVELWEMAGRTLVGSWDASPGRILALAFSRDGNTLLTASGSGVVRLWGVSR